jgi:hypothetical protein
MQFSFKVANSAGSTKTVAFLTGTFDTYGITLSEGTPNTYVPHSHYLTEIAARFTDIQAVADDATVISGVVCSALQSKFTIKHFRDWMKYRTAPVYLRQIIMSSTATTQWSELLTMRVDNPFEDKGERVYQLQDYFNPNQYQDGKIYIPFVTADYPKGTPITQNAIAYLSVPTGVTTTVTLDLQF